MCNCESKKCLFMLFHECLEYVFFAKEIVIVKSRGKFKREAFSSFRCGLWFEDQCSAKDMRDEHSYISFPFQLNLTEDLKKPD